jgi:hypothetical protein
VVQFWNESAMITYSLSTSFDVNAVGPFTATLPLLAADTGGLWVRSGSSWLSQFGYTTNSLYGAPDRFVGPARVVGASGTVLAYAGPSWVTHGSGTTATLYDVDASYAGENLAVGAGGVMIRETPTGWQSARTYAAPTLYEIWGSGPDDVWAVGSYGRTVHWDGDRWRTYPNYASRATTPIALSAVPAASGSPATTESSCTGTAASPS